MQRHRVLDDGEPEPGAALVARAGFVDAIEAFEHARQVFGRNARARVAHLTPRAAIGFAHGHDDPAALSVLDRVVDEVGKHLGQPHPVGKHPHRRHALEHQLEPRVRCGLAHLRQLFGGERMQIQRFAPQRRIGPLELGQRQQILDQGLQAHRLVPHHAHERLAVLGVIEPALEQRLGIAAQRGERRAQLVRHIGDEVLPQALQRFAFRQIVQHQQHRARPAAAERRGGGVRRVGARGPGLELALHRATAGASRRRQLGEFRHARERGEGRARPGPQRRVEQLGEAVVHVHHAVAAIDQRHAIAHVGEDELAVVALAAQRFEPSVELAMHGVERAPELAEVVVRGLRRPRAGVTLADATRHALQQAQSSRKTSAHIRQHQHAREQRHRGRGHRQPHQRHGQPLQYYQWLGESQHRRVRTCQRHGAVKKLHAQRGRAAHLQTHATPQRGRHLLPPGVVLHARGRRARIREHRTVARDQGHAQVEPGVERVGIGLPGVRARSGLGRRGAGGLARGAPQHIAFARDEPAALLRVFHHREQCDGGDHDQHRHDQQPRPQRQPHALVRDAGGNGPTGGTNL